MNSKPQQFSLEVVDDYIHMKTWGRLNLDDVDVPAKAALELAHKKKIKKLLDNISEVDSSGTNIAIQAKGVGVLWKLREFDKVAIVFSESHLQKLFFSTLEAIHLEHEVKFNGFDNEAEAIAWLKKD